MCYMELARGRCSPPLNPRLPESGHWSCRSTPLPESLAHPHAALQDAGWSRRPPRGAERFPHRPRQRMRHPHATLHALIKNMSGAPFACNDVSQYDGGTTWALCSSMQSFQPARVANVSHLSVISAALRNPR